MTTTAGQVHWICKVPLGITFSALGILGNLVSVFVWRKALKTSYAKNANGNPSTAKHLILLGLVDTGVLLSLLVIDSIPEINPRVMDSYIYGVLFSWIFSPFLFLFFIASVLLVAGVTINRWALISFPVRSKEFYSNRNTLISLGGIVIFSMLLNIPMWFTHTVDQITVQVQVEHTTTELQLKSLAESPYGHLKGNITNGSVETPRVTFYIHETEYGKSEEFFNYMSWCHCFIFVDIPWITVAILNVLILRKMRKRTRVTGINLESELRRKKEERNLTFMLLGSTSAFIICMSLHCITNTWRRFTLLHHVYGHTGELATEVDVGSAIGRLGIVLNSSVNCLFYCFGGRTFKKTLRESMRFHSSIAPKIFETDGKLSDPVLIIGRKMVPEAKPSRPPRSVSVGTESTQCYQNDARIECS